MSDPSPLPPFAVPAPEPAPPVQPVPVRAIPYTLPTTGGVPSRPRPLTALGIASIVAACLSLVACLGTAAFAVLFHLAARDADAAIAAAAPAPAPPAFLAPANPAPPRVEVGPRGLAAAPRRVAAEAIESIHPLTPPRAEQLDAILARAGANILDLPDGRELTADAVRAAVADHGEMFSGNRRVAPPDYFKTAAGRLELHDDRAVFYPADRSPPVRSTTASAAAPRPLTAEQVQSLVKQVREAPGGARLNAAQVSGVSAALSFPNQRLAQASSGLNGEPRAVTLHPGGGATIRFNGGELYLGPQGQILGDPPTVSRQPPAAANTGAFAATLAAVAANLALAVLLIVAGILVLRPVSGPPRGRRLHTAWAVMKIVSSLAAAAALYWMLDSFLDAAAALPGGGSFAGAPARRAARWARAAYYPAVVGAALGCVYPVVVLIAFGTRAIREHYRPAE